MAEAEGCGFKYQLQLETFHVGINFLPSFLPVEIPQNVTIINEKNHLQTSLYRLLWVVYQVHDL